MKGEKTMKTDDYMNRTNVMRTADRKLLRYIASAAYHLRCAEELMADYNDLAHLFYYQGMREEWPDMARLYRQLCQADLQAAKYLIDDLADLELIDGPDWQTIKHWLVWFGFPAEFR